MQAGPSTSKELERQLVGAVRGLLQPLGFHRDFAIRQGHAFERTRAPVLDRLIIYIGRRGRSIVEVLPTWSCGSPSLEAFLHSTGVAAHHRAFWLDLEPEYRCRHVIFDLAREGAPPDSVAQWSLLRIRPWLLHQKGSSQELLPGSARREFAHPSLLTQDLLGALAKFVPYFESIKTSSDIVQMIEQSSTDLVGVGQLLSSLAQAWIGNIEKVRAAAVHLEGSLLEVQELHRRSRRHGEEIEAIQCVLGVLRKSLSGGTAPHPSSGSKD